MTLYGWCSCLFVLLLSDCTIAKVEQLNFYPLGFTVSKLNNGNPKFLQPIKNVTAAVGREAVLSCSVTDLGSYKVGWMKADDQTVLSLHTRVITHNPRISVTYDDNLKTWQLKIRQLNESDRGCYMCQVNTEEMSKQVGCVDVLVPPDINDSGTSSDVTVSEGENVTLSCNASGHPKPRIIWRREEDSHIKRKNESRDIEKVDNLNTPTLTLWNVVRQQIGSYLCIASNDVPPAVSKRITLNINFAPVIAPVTTTVAAPLSATARLQCVVEAFPRAQNLWRKENKILTDSSKHNIQQVSSGRKISMILTVFDLSHSDFGTYKCVSSNSVGTSENIIVLQEIIITTPSTTTSSSTTTVSTDTLSLSTVSDTTTTIEQTTRPVYDNPMGEYKQNPSDRWLFPSVVSAPLELESFTNGVSFTVFPLMMILITLPVHLLS